MSRELLQRAFDALKLSRDDVNEVLCTMLNNDRGAPQVSFQRARLEKHDASIADLLAALAAPVGDGPSIYIRADQLKHVAEWGNALCELSTEPRSDRVRIYTHPALASTVAPAEPVAWRWQPSAVFLDWSWTDSGIKARDVANNGVDVQPLYTHPIPSSTPAAWLMDSGDDSSINVSAISAERDAMREALRDQPGLAERAFAAMQAKDAQAHTDRMAKAPPGACPACYGEGEQGGQFCGGFWQCDSCGGTGKV